jgi:uncharacterized membrane protein YfcA
MSDFLFIGLVAFFTSLLSGLLGLGGSVVLIPAYLYLPQFFNLTPLDAKSISGMTSVQVLFSSTIGMFLHRRRGVVNTHLVYTMGVPIAVAALGGAFLSGALSPRTIIAVFACMAITSAAFILTRNMNNDDVPAGPLSYSTEMAILIALSVGFFGGIAGAPGAFLISPLMMIVLKIPTRITIGSTLGIVLLSAFSTSVGKFATGQVPPLHTLAAVIGALPGVMVGSMMSHRLSVTSLRRILAGLISLVGLRMLYEVIMK